MPPAAELDKVGKRYGDRTVLQDVDLTIGHGEIVVLVGPNGAGKTTLTRIMATLLRPTSGKVTITGHDAITDAVAVRRSIAIVPQGVTTDPYTTPWEHVFHYLRARGHNRHTAAERTEATLRALDMWDRRDARAQTLSGGYQRRTILAMALATRSRLLLLDEPTTALDPEARRQVWNQLAAVRPHTSILVTTHDMDEAEMLNDRIALIADGRLVAVDTLPALLRGLPAAEKFLLDAPGLPVDRYGTAQQVAGRTVIYPHDPESARALATALVDTATPFSVRPTDLEDCYFHLLAQGTSQAPPLPVGQP